ncbi:unnamed protein product [Gongylonema pulchrum]|uniref:Uncharacterized protein n=1 Tax=Gongylonema pulchrum TaxID=637853 RepID=A0A3P7NQR4_9BILA|nr:unnamed protein product [Gongylonema pulchrum]
MKASLKLYNGTDAVSRISDDTVLMKAAWDKIMIEVMIYLIIREKIFAPKKSPMFQKSCCGVDSKIGDFNESGWYHLTGRKHHFPPACCPPNRDGTLMEFCPTIARYGDVCCFFTYIQISVV